MQIKRKKINKEITKMPLINKTETIEIISKELNILPADLSNALNKIPEVESDAIKVGSLRVALGLDANAWRNDECIATEKDLIEALRMNYYNKKLKPCSICGAKGHLIPETELGEKSTKFPIYSVGCERCSNSTYSTTMEYATRFWNEDNEYYSTTNPITDIVIDSYKKALKEGKIKYCICECKDATIFKFNGKEGNIWQNHDRVSILYDYGLYVRYFKNCPICSTKLPMSSEKYKKHAIHSNDYDVLMV